MLGAIVLITLIIWGVFGETLLYGVTTSRSKLVRILYILIFPIVFFIGVIIGGN
jgi:hypothetical protein